MTTIGIIRHGITAWNIEKRAQGSSNIPLHENGLQEARKLAERLSLEKWDFIYSSPLLRAKQTAEIIAEKLGNTDIIFDERLREVGGGQIEGTTEEERIKKWGPNWRELDLGMEKLESVKARGISFMEGVTKKHPNENILIVSHGGLIKGILSTLQSDTPMEDNLKNTSLTKLKMTSYGWEVELYNCTKHLD